MPEEVQKVRVEMPQRRRNDGHHEKSVMEVLSMFALLVKPAAVHREALGADGVVPPPTHFGYSVWMCT